MAAAIDKYYEYKAVNDALVLLATMGWRPEVLAALPTLLRQSDSPRKFSTVLNGIDTIEKMRMEEEALSRRIKASREEIAHDEKFKAMINTWDENPVLKNVIEIMINPGSVVLSPEKKAGYLYIMLENYDLFPRKPMTLVARAS